MLAAISTTILSRRSCALTCSAMVSRSRLNRTRGPPDALRIGSNPLPPGQVTGRPVASVKLETQQFYSFGGAVNPVYRPNRPAKTVAQITIGLIQAVYRIEPCFAKQKPCQGPDSEVRVILRSTFRTSESKGPWKTY